METIKIICGIALVLTATLEAQSIYVANDYSGTIGEYGPDGSTINASLISGLNSPSSIAVFGTNLFVASFSSQEHAYTIGKYTTSGSTVNASLITGFDPQGIAVSGNDLLFRTLATARLANTRFLGRRWTSI